MDVVSLCALRASGFEWQPRAGSYAFTVLCKATFELHPKECVLAPRQEEPLGVDVYRNNDPTRSIVVPSDRAPYKPRADVVLVGHAYAPKQQPARSVMTRLLVGEIDKSIEVWCERRVRKHGQQVFEGPRLARMPLTWEHAAGGSETNNPVGLRFDAAPDQYGMVAIPNLQPPDVYVVQWGDTFEPTGYGPIAPWWPSRMRRLYQHGSRFAVQGWEKQPLPQDFDYGYFNVAPPDQQVEEVRANERIVMENLHPQHERLVTNLPGIRPRAVADRATGEREEIALVADTLWIDTDRGICAVVWRGRMGLRHPQEAGRVAFWVDKLPENSVVWAISKHGPTILSVRENELEAATMTLTPSDYAENRPTLPFIKGTPVTLPLDSITPKVSPPMAGPITDVRARDDGTETIVAPMAGPLNDPLPFAPAAGVSPIVAGEPAAPNAVQFHVNDTTRTVEPNLEPLAQQSGESLPFQSSVAHVPPPEPGFIPAPEPVALSIRGKPILSENDSRKVKELVKEGQPWDIAPPPMIGPVATVAMIPVPEAKPDVHGPRYVAPDMATTQKLVVPVEKRNIGDFPLERCAALTARIARSKSEKGRILDEEKLSPEQWALIQKQWADAIREETKKGKKTLLDRFDVAYVEQLERERGPIRVQEYATLMVAAERGTIDGVLNVLGLPGGAIMRIERVWMRRVTEVSDLSEELDKALERARGS